MPTIYGTTYTDVFSGNLVTPAFPQFDSFDLSSSITLSWPNQFQNNNTVVSLIMVINPTMNGLSVTMPDAREVGTGFSFTIYNPGNFTFSLLDNTGALIATIPTTVGPLTERIFDFILSSNATQEGTWIYVPRGGGSPAVTSINADSNSDNLVITGVPITTAGTIYFALANDLLALSLFGANTGITVRRGAANWALVSLQQTANQIVIVNPDGVAGNPTISLAPAISGITSIELPNLSFGVSGPNVIESTNVNGNLTFAANGTGVIQLSNETDLLPGSRLKFFDSGGNGHYIAFRSGATLANQDLIWPTTAATPGQVLQNLDGTSLTWASITTFGGPSTLNALAKFSNTTGSLTNSVIIVDNAGVATGFASAAIGFIQIGGTAGPSNQTIATTGGNLDLIISPNGTGSLLVQGDVLVKPSSGIQRKLSLYNTAGTFFSSFNSDPNIVASVQWTLPPTDSAGVFTSNGAGIMSITPLFPVASTVNAVARYSNTTGALKDSLFLITDAGAGSGLISCNIGSVTIGTLNTITTNIDNTNLNLTADGTGIVQSTGNFNILPKSGVTSSLILSNQAGTFSTSIMALPLLAASYTWTLPAADANGVIKSDGAGNLSMLSVFTGPSTVNAIARYSNTIGSIQNSTVLLDGSGNLTGITSAAIGNINLSANTITTATNQPLTIQPNGTGALTLETTSSGNLTLNAGSSGSLIAQSDLNLQSAGSSRKIVLFNAAGFGASIIPNAAMAANSSFTLPASASAGLLKSDSSGNLSINSLGASAGILRTDGSGNVTVNTVVSSVNAVAKFTDTVGSLTDSSNTFLDANANLSIGSSAIGTSGTNTITILQGTAVTAVAANNLSIGTRNTGTGNVIALYGAADGGISTSSTLTADINTKLSVYVNGTRYYIIASTAAG